MFICRPSPCRKGTVAGSQDVVFVYAKWCYQQWPAKGVCDNEQQTFASCCRRLIIDSKQRLSFRSAIGATKSHLGRVHGTEDGIVGNECCVFPIDSTPNADGASGPFYGWSYGAM
jgi:hypothetical protein